MASFDSSKLSYEYDALIRARSEDDVRETLKLANKYKIPVTPRGTGTSLTGSASPVKGGWVLDVSLMKRIAIKKDKAMASREDPMRAQAIPGKPTRPQGSPGEPKRARGSSGELRGAQGSTDGRP